jgi:hypothetical protein
MEKFLKKLRGKEHNYVLAALLAIFVIFPVSLPQIVAEMINTVIGKVVIVIIALNLFLAHPMVGAIGLLAAYELIKRSENTKISQPTHRFIPSERKKVSNLNKYNQFPVTVEELVIAKQIPYVFKTKKSASSAGYKPVQDSVQGAAKL